MKRAGTSRFTGMFFPHATAFTIVFVKLLLIQPTHHLKLKTSFLHHYSQHSHITHNRITTDTTHSLSRSLRFPILPHFLPYLGSSSRHTPLFFFQAYSSVILLDVRGMKSFHASAREVSAVKRSKKSSSIYYAKPHPSVPCILVLVISSGRRRGHDLWQPSTFPSLAPVDRHNRPRRTLCGDYRGDGFIF